MLGSLRRQSISLIFSICSRIRYLISSVITAEELSEAWLIKTYGAMTSSFQKMQGRSQSIGTAADRNSSHRFVVLAHGRG